MGTPIYGMQVLSGSDPAQLDDVVNGAVQSVEDHMPHRYVNSLAQLKAMSGGVYVDGMTAVLATADGGCNEGCIFVRAAGKWRFASGTIINLTTFVSNIGANLNCMDGAIFYDQGNSVVRVFTTQTGNSEIILGGNTWTLIPYPKSYKRPFGYGIGYRLVPGGVRLRGVIARKDGRAWKEGVVTNVLTLPPEARPTSTIYFNAPGKGNAIGGFEISSDGVLTFRYASNRTSSWYSFDQAFIPLS